MTAQILLAAHDERLAELRACLAGMAFRVGAAVSSAVEAIAAAERIVPDLALVDLALPGAVDGVEAGRRISCVMGIPLIFLTDGEDAKLLERAVASEPDSYIVEPFSDA